MEGLIVGTEHQLGILETRGIAPMGEASEQLIAANNATLWYGVPSTPVGDAQINTRLFNGGLIYNDLGHPEYATPELRTLDDVAAFEQAGWRIVQNLVNLARLRNLGHVISTKETPRRYLVVANNTDHHLEADLFSPKTFAYHENYAAKDPADEAIDIIPFLITRQIFVGSGFVTPSRFFGRTPSLKEFAISQRALAVNVRGVGKLNVGRYSAMVGASRHNREILHITCGEANVSRYATKLKIGTTALVHLLLQEGWRLPVRFRCSHPELIVSNFWTIATDMRYRWIYKSNSGRRMRAVDVQREYLDACKKRFGGSRDSDTQWVLREWEATLDQLETDPIQADRLDWVKKMTLLFGSGGLTNEERVRIDMGYHMPQIPNLTSQDEKGIFGLVCGDDSVPEDAIIRAMENPPQDTRAAGRGIIIRAIAKAIKNGADEQPLITWSKVRFAGQPLEMPHPQRTYSSEAQVFARSIEGGHRGPERR